MPHLDTCVTSSKLVHQYMLKWLLKVPGAATKKDGMRFLQVP